jgi:hypothetical protein
LGDEGEVEEPSEKTWASSSEVKTATRAKNYESLESVVGNFWIPEDIWNQQENKVSTVTDKATKSDDAGVPEHVWNRRVVAGFPHLRSQLTTPQARNLISTVETALDTIRKMALRFWKNKLEKEFVVWFHGTEHKTDKREDIEQRGYEAAMHA